MYKMSEKMDETNKQILENFLDAYLVSRDIEKTLSLVTEDVYSIGTGVHEVARNRDELRALIEDEISQISGPIIYNLDTYCEKKVSGDAFITLCDVTSSLKLDEDNTIDFTTRLTAGFKRVNGEYLAYHFHMSEASSAQEEQEFFPLHYGVTAAAKIDEADQMGLVDLMKKTLPGGAMGGYVEPGFPLYFINDELLSWLGYTYDEFISENGQMMSNTIHQDDIERVERIVYERFAKDEEYSVEYRMKKKSGSYIWVRDIGRKTVTPSGRIAMISIIVDISSEIARKESFEKAIESMKQERRRIDRMTGLLNREPAEVLITKDLSMGKGGAFFLIDIDNFKLVNDVKGHPIGDEVLKKFADILMTVFQQREVIARLGGDEFIVFIPEQEDIEILKGLADNVIIQSEFLIDDEILARKLGASIGIALAPEDGDTFAMLYANADKAQYYAKRNGKNRYSFYRREANETLQTHQNANMESLNRILQSAFIDIGAFPVEFEAFNKIYQFLERNLSRMEQRTQIILFTIHKSDDLSVTEEAFAEHRKLLENCIKYRLRSGDLMMDFSSNQIAVLLVNCNYEDGIMVSSRIMNSYTEDAGEDAASVTYEIHSMSEE